MHASEPSSIPPPLAFSWRRLFPSLLAAALLSISWGLSFTGKHGPPCLFRLLTGIPCPGCGLTRSLTALWQGDISASLRYHPLGILIFAACWGILLAGLLPKTRVWFTARVFRRTLTQRLGYLTFVLLIVVWLAKMIDWWAGGHLFLL